MCIFTAMSVSSRRPLYLSRLDSPYLFYVELAAPVSSHITYVDKCDIHTYLIPAQSYRSKLDLRLEVLNMSIA